MSKRCSHILIALLASVAVVLAPCPVGAQTQLKMESQLSASSGTNTPLWLNANKYGLSSLDKTNGYLRVGLFSPAVRDSSRQWSVGYGVDLALAANYTSTLVVQQAFAEARWRGLTITLGSKQQPVELKNQQLSTGAQTIGVNARPVPSLRLSVDNYLTIPHTGNRVAVKGHLSYGMLTDSKWEEDFTRQMSKYNRNTLHHTKAGYVRLGNPQRPLTMELGLEMGCQFGGTTYTFADGQPVNLKNSQGLESFLNAFIPGGGDRDEGIYENKEGNHLGSYLLRVNLNKPRFCLSVYADHFFEDHSQMFFVDYDGYGEGEEYNQWKKNRWLLYGIHDIMLGVELRLKQCRWVSDVVCEYMYTKYQSGPVYHDRSPLISDHVAGQDDYYNHYIYSGWQHWGQVMGNPLYRSPIYNTNGAINVLNNRFWAWHLGVSGKPFSGISYRLLATTQKGWGTYFIPLPRPQHNTSLLAEAAYSVPVSSSLRGWSLKAAWGMDHGALLGNNMGVQLTVAKTMEFKQWNR